MKNLHSATGLSNSFLLSALAILASCSTPKYYQFNNRAVSSSITADTLVLAEALESTNIEPVTSFADPAMALQLLAEAWVDSSLFSTEQSVTKRQFRRELRKMVKEDPLWNSLASTASPLPTLDDEKQRKEDGVPPMNKVALLAAIFSTISLLGLLTPVFWLFVLPALILGIIGLRKTKQSGERGRGLAVVAIALSSLFLLLFIFVVVQIALLAGEG